MKISPARSRCTPAPIAMTAGTTIWTMPVPRLPPAALGPSALPFSASGKKNEMLVIDDAKLPPPKPASAAPGGGPERRLGSGHDERESGCREEQEQRGDDRPVAPGEGRHRERVGDADRRADEARDGDEPELLVEGEIEACCGEQGHDNRPERPDAEAQELGEDGEGEVARATLRPVDCQKVASSGSQCSIPRPSRVEDAVEVAGAGTSGPSVAGASAAGAAVGVVVSMGTERAEPVFQVPAGQENRP